MSICNPTPCFIYVVSAGPLWPTFYHYKSYIHTYSTERFATDRHSFTYRFWNTHVPLHIHMISRVSRLSAFKPKWVDLPIQPKKYNWTPLCCSGELASQSACQSRLDPPKSKRHCRHNRICEKGQVYSENAALTPVFILNFTTRGSRQKQFIHRTEVRRLEKPIIWLFGRSPNFFNFIFP